MGKPRLWLGMAAAIGCIYAVACGTAGGPAALDQGTSATAAAAMAEVSHAAANVEASAATTASATLVGAQKFVARAINPPKHRRGFSGVSGDKPRADLECCCDDCCCFPCCGGCWGAGGDGGGSGQCPEMESSPGSITNFPDACLNAANGGLIPVTATLGATDVFGCVGTQSYSVSAICYAIPNCNGNPPNQSCGPIPDGAWTGTNPDIPNIYCAGGANSGSCFFDVYTVLLTGSPSYVGNCTGSCSIGNFFINDSVAADGVLFAGETFGSPQGTVYCGGNAVGSC